MDDSDVKGTTAKQLTEQSRRSKLSSKEEKALLHSKKQGIVIAVVRLHLENPFLRRGVSTHSCRYYVPFSSSYGRYQCTVLDTSSLVTSSKPGSLSPLSSDGWLHWSFSAYHCGKVDILSSNLVAMYYN